MSYLKFLKKKLFQVKFLKNAKFLKSSGDWTLSSIFLHLYPFSFIPSSRPLSSIASLSISSVNIHFHPSPPIFCMFTLAADLKAWSCILWDRCLGCMCCEWLALETPQLRWREEDCTIFESSAQTAPRCTTLHSVWHTRFAVYWILDDSVKIQGKLWRAGQQPGCQRHDIQYQDDGAIEDYPWLGEKVKLTGIHTLWSREWIIKLIKLFQLFFGIKH